MTDKMIKESQPAALHRAMEVVKSGGVIVFPTDTVYGLGCSLFRPEGIARLYSIKGRDTSKAIAVLLADLDQVELVAKDLDARALKLASCYWPGALTIVVKKHPSIPEVLSALPTVGIRIPNHPFARALIRAVGPMAVTSANLAGQPSGTTIPDILAQLGDIVDLLIDGGKSAGGLSSTVVDCTGSEPVVLREGPIRQSEILHIWSAED
jgi:L-threonylcarbamoyladenylate synthase